MAKRPKILILIHSLGGGGAQRATSLLSRQLVDNGYEAVVVTVASADADFFGLDERVVRISLGLAGRSSGLERLTANAGRLRALRSVIRRERPDIVLGMMTTSAILAILANVGLSARVIASERTFPGARTVPLAWSGLRRVLYRFADAHVAQTQMAADWLRRNCAATNVHIIPNGVSWPIPAQDPEVDPDTVIPNSHCVLLAVGRGVAEKGFDLLVSAFSRIAQRYPNWVLVIAGPEPDAIRGLLDIAKANGILGRILFPGRIGNIADWYARADVFVLSSRVEGFPNVLLEAMASGCCCVAFDCKAGPADLIKHLDNGMLVEAGSVQGLAEAMELVISDARLRKKLAMNAQVLRSAFGEKEIFRHWERVFQP